MVSAQHCRVCERVCVRDSACVLHKQGWVLHLSVYCQRTVRIGHVFLSGVPARRKPAAPLLDLLRECGHLPVLLHEGQLSLLVSEGSLHLFLLYLRMQLGPQ